MIETFRGFGEDLVERNVGGQAGTSENNQIIRRQHAKQSHGPRVCVTRTKPINCSFCITRAAHGFTKDPAILIDTVALCSH